jgi:hypothetical protein
MQSEARTEGAETTGRSSAFLALGAWGISPTNIAASVKNSSLGCAGQRCRESNSYRIFVCLPLLRDQTQGLRDETQA